MYKKNNVMFERKIEAKYKKWVVKIFLMHIWLLVQSTVPVKSVNEKKEEGEERNNQGGKERKGGASGNNKDFAGSDGRRNWWDDPRGWPGWWWKGQKFCQKNVN